MSEQLKIYIAGPMTGIAENNYPAFLAAEEVLRERWGEVLNPARNFDGRKGLSWADYMRASIGQLVQATDAVFLPGWHASPGARMERKLAEDLKITIWEAEELGL